MRYLVVFMLLVGLVGCQEKGPTAAERASVYMAAKAELERLEKQKLDFEATLTKSAKLEIDRTKEEWAEIDDAIKKLDMMIEDAREVMLKNSPTIP